MNYPNPSRLTLGSSGVLAGQQFHVVGRVVLGIQQDGETYFWNEFHLIDAAGKSAILVYEDEEDDSPWKLFTYLEGAPSLSAAEAASVREGQTIRLAGLAAKVTFVGHSRVYFIEGRPPEGVEVGDEASYFNATAGHRQIVVSWTGDEVEIFQGVDLPNHAVPQAFKLPRLTNRFTAPPAPIDRVSDGGTQWFGAIKMIIVLALVAVIAAKFISCRSTAGSAPVRPVAAPSSPLVTGATGMLSGVNWRVSAHHLVEVAETGRRFQRHDYLLDSADGLQSLLVLGLNGRYDEWFLLSSLPLSDAISGSKLAALRGGNEIKIQNVVARIESILLTKILAAESSTQAIGRDTFNFLAIATNRQTFMVTWSQETLRGWVGARVDARRVEKAFKSGDR